MKKLLLDDTIAAVSTPIGKSGIGIVRLSGRKALSIADKIFLPSNGLSPSGFPSHTIHYGRIKDIDEVLLTVMRAPRTYTREDIVEINCHSGIVILRRILDLLLKSGARLAEPGEFTKRAYLAGRIDLAQAEAVLDMINSRTDKAQNAALGQLKGELSRRIKALRKSILDVLTHLEVSIDFSDRDLPAPSSKRLLKMMQRASRDIRILLDSADKGTILRQGITCVICGKPNVGKSSLLNALLKEDRAIVAAVAGTTRDTLEETVDLSGIPLKLVDTAGIIKGKNIVEREAVKRSRRYLKQADLVLLVLDSNRRISFADRALAREVSNRPVFVVLNKQDLPLKISLRQAKEILPQRKFVPVSALRGKGLDRLKKEIADYIWQGKVSSSSEILITNIRHARALKRAQRFIRRAVKALQSGQSPEVVCLDMQAAQKSLGEIIGRISCEDILGHIFSQFCIGK
jgi:tRNA modification GTPase